jgi:CBS domain-containing protein
MAQSLRDVMTSNPCTIDADKSVAYAAKMMQEEDVGLAPIVEGDMLVGMLTDRDIAVRVAAEGRNPEQVNVLEVASKKIVTIDPQQDLDDALRIMAQHQVRRLPVVEEDGRLIGVVAQADIAREGDDATTGQLVQEISDSGGQMSSIEEQDQGFGVQPQFEAAVPEPDAGPEIQEEEEVSRVQAASARPRRRSTRKRTTTARKRSTSKRSTSGRKKTTSRKKSTTSRKKSTASRKRSTTKKRSTAKRSTAKRKTTSRKRSTAAKRGAAKRKTTSRKRSTAAKRGAAKKRSTAKRGTAKRKTTSRKRSTAAKRGAAKRKTTTRKRAAAGRKGGRKTARKRSTVKRSTAKRSTAKRRTTRRRTSRK